MSFLTWYVKRRIRKGDFMKTGIGYLLKLGFIQNNRRIAGVVLLIAAALVQFLSSPDLLNLCAGLTAGPCGWVNRIQAGLAIAGTYVGTVGVLFRNDPRK